LLDLFKDAVSCPILDFADAIWNDGVMFLVMLIDTEVLNPFVKVGRRRQAGLLPDVAMAKPLHDALRTQKTPSHYFQSNMPLPKQRGEESTLLKRKQLQDILKGIVHRREQWHLIVDSERHMSSYSDLLFPTSGCQSNKLVCVRNR
jgi:hypothetical protein